MPSPALTLPATVEDPRTPQELAATVRAFAARRELWEPLARFTTPERWYHRLAAGTDHEVWLLTWLPGQGTEIHDHGGASGAFGVVRGALTERSFALPGAGGRPPRTRALPLAAVRSFGPRHVHEVTNTGAEPAVSIHAYAPALATMSYYTETDDGRLRLDRTDAVED
ncbi:cysteine dioxygenase family protein [Streptomyces sp. DSM 44915]|uniref:Cysteine dioxygenase family protein n=1 Tax=Streptomyces chisholmiae TaxID=3075540 RepID=A0ABU2JMV0_9ACTN|nr:cysteine dioxygenase family protein [Streptomyces sp. DSM 44915]MDT0266312.1 cysteine dioxygenase family protein [Streptomyces sp. DSM 44915]